MGGLNKILTIFLCGVVLSMPVAHASDCTNPTFRKQNPSKCNYGISTTTVATGITAIAAGAATFVAMAGGGGGGTKSPTNAQPTLSLYNYSNVGGDVDSVRLAAVMGNNSYARNWNQFNDIRVAYSLARGYTGKSAHIAIFDTDTTLRHGANVRAIAGGTIAPDATISQHKIANGTVDFLPWNQIGDIIHDTTQNKNPDQSIQHIYNNSWNVSRGADTIYARNQLEQLTDKKFIDAVSSAAQNDVIFVWAAGNDGMAQSGALSAMPAVMDELHGRFVNVVAWDSATQQLADYSNACGITRDWCITAPGTDIDTGTRIVSGTSFAAPIVSSAIAVLHDAHPYVPTADLVSILLETARDVGEPGVDDVYGHGVLDLERATRPVGVELVPISDAITTRMSTSHVPGNIAHQIAANGVTFASIDSYGRAFENKMSDKIRIRNRSRGLDALRGPDRTAINMGQMEFGFEQRDFALGTGFLKTEEKNITTFIAANPQFTIGATQLFARIQIGKSNPRPTPDSMISDFSDIWSTSTHIGIRAYDWTIGFAIPDAIIDGHMVMRTPSGRTTNGNLQFQDYHIDMRGISSHEYSVGYKFITAAFVDNKYGSDEFYIMAKSKIAF